jgi:hypothetical protein
MGAFSERNSKRVERLGAHCERYIEQNEKIRRHLHGKPVTLTVFTRKKYYCV